MSLIDRRFLDVRFLVHGVVNDVPEGVVLFEGVQFIVGDNPTGVFSGASKNDIAVYYGDELGWKFHKPVAGGMEFFDVSDYAYKRWNGSEFERVLGLATNGMIFENEDAYSDSRAYFMGDYCFRDSKFYRCLVDMEAPEPWTAEHWVEVAVASELRRITNGMSASMVWFDIDENGHLIMTYSDDDNPPNVEIREDGHLYLTV